MRAVRRPRRRSGRGRAPSPRTLPPAGSVAPCPCIGHFPALRYSNVFGAANRGSPTRGVVSTETRIRSVSATAQWPLLVLCLVGAIAGTAGVYWDLGWHYDRGRDTAFSAPHLLVAFGSMLLGLAVFAWSVLVSRGARRSHRIVLPLREYGGVTYSPLLLVAFIASLVPPLALAIDEVWHQLFGLDTSLWSPTHLLAIVAGPVALLA